MDHHVGRRQEVGCANKMKWAIWIGCITRAMFCKFISFFIAKNVGMCTNLVGKHSMGSVLYVGDDCCNEELIQVVGLRRGVLDVVVQKVDIIKIVCEDVDGGGRVIGYVRLLTILHTILHVECWGIQGV